MIKVNIIEDTELLGIGVRGRLLKEFRFVYEEEEYICRISGFTFAQKLFDHFEMGLYDIYRAEGGSRILHFTFDGNNFLFACNNMKAKTGEDSALMLSQALTAFVAVVKKDIFYWDSIKP